MFGPRDLISRSLGAAALAVALLVAPGSWADDVKQFGKQAPSNAELNRMLFPELSKTGEGQTRGVSRGLVFTGRKPDAAAEPAAEKAPAPKAFGMAIEFAFNSAEISPESVASLDQIGSVLSQNRAIEFSITIVGHTDAVGEDSYNQRLSERRAAAVKAYFVDNHGVDPTRLATAGQGEAKLVDQANPEAAANRRVEFHRLQ